MVHIYKVALVTAQETAVAKLILNIAKALVNRVSVARGTVKQAF